MKKRKVIFCILGFAFSILPPLIAVVELFPLMAAAGKVSLLVSVFLLLACIPLFKHLRRLLVSPAPWMVWGMMFLFCLLIRSLIDEFYTISMLGLIGSAIGAVFFRIAKGGAQT